MCFCVQALQQEVSQRSHELLCPHPGTAAAAMSMATRHARLRTARSILAARMQHGQGRGQSTAKHQHVGEEDDERGGGEDAADATHARWQQAGGFL